jgi:hypothetical protein
MLEIKWLRNRSWRLPSLLRIAFNPKLLLTVRSQDKAPICIELLPYLGELMQLGQGQASEWLVERRHHPGRTWIRFGLVVFSPSRQRPLPSRCATRLHLVV